MSKLLKQIKIDLLDRAEEFATQGNKLNKQRPLSENAKQIRKELTRELWSDKQTDSLCKLFSLIMGEQISVDDNREWVAGTFVRLQDEDVAEVEERIFFVVGGAGGLTTEDLDLEKTCLDSNTAIDCEGEEYPLYGSDAISADAKDIKEFISKASRKALITLDALLNKEEEEGN